MRSVGKGTEVDWNKDTDGNASCIDFDMDNLG
jgi:hypothetical protein